MHPWFFTEFGLFWCKVSYVFPPLHQESLVFHTSFPLPMQIFLCFSTSLDHCTKNPHEILPTFFHIFGPTAPNMLCFSLSWCNISCVFRLFWPYCAKNAGFFHRIFHMFGPTGPKIVGSSQGFPLQMLSQDFSSSDAKIPTCANKHTTMVTAEYAKKLQIFWPKTIFCL